MKRRRRVVKPEGSDEEVRLFKDLCDLLQEAGVETRVEKGDFRGGYCVVEGEKRILILNKKHPLDRRIAVLLAEIKNLDGVEIELTESLRARLEDL